MRNSRLMCAGCAVVALLAPAALLARTLPKPLFTIVYLRRGDRSIAGHLVTYNHRRLVILMANHKRTHLRWSALTPSSAFNLRARLINQKSAADWLKLGEFGWKLDVKRLARNALNRAAALNPALRHQVNKILLTPAGAGFGGSGSAAGSRASSRSHRARHHHRSGARHSASPLYRRASTSVARKRLKMALAIMRHFNARPTRYGLREITTKHFIIFTDWNAADRAGVPRGLEHSYRFVAHALGVPRHAPVFAGKLPVFMLFSGSELWAVRSYILTKYHLHVATDQFEEGITFTNPNRGLLLGYLPPANTYAPAAAKVHWQYVTTKQMTREFLIRYRSQRPLKSWFEDGIANLVGDFAAGNAWDSYGYCHDAVAGPPIRNLFRGTYINNNEALASETVVGLLMARSRKEFHRALLDQKAGMTFHHALRKEYHLTYNKLAKLWHAHMARVLARGNPGG